MQLKRNRTKFLSFVGMSLTVALAPLACGSDDEGEEVTNGGSSSAGKGGKGGSSAGKGGTGGKASTGGSVNLGGDATGGEDATGGAGGAPGATTARLRVVHASPSAPAVDIYAKDAAVPAATDVAYGDATEFIEVDAGPISFDLRAAGDDPDNQPAFTTDEIELTAGSDYTVVAAGDLANAADPDVGFRILTLEHDFDPAAAGTAVARVVHATSAWDTVDLDAVAIPGVELPGLERFGDASNLPVPADTLIEVAFQNETSGTLSKLVLPELTEADQLFVIATGNPGQPFRAPANGFALLIVDQDSNVVWVKEQPWIHLVHASDVAAAVDVYDAERTAAAAKLVDDLAAGALAPFQLPESIAGITLKAVAANAASGAATENAIGETSTLVAGEHYLSYIAGDAIFTVHEQFDLEQPTKVVLRGVHASADLTATVDFGLANASALTNVLIPDITPNETSAELGVPLTPGTATLGAAVAGDTTPLLAEKTFTGGSALAAGERGFVMLVGLGELWFVDTSVAGWTVR